MSEGGKSCKTSWLILLNFNRFVWIISFEPNESRHESQCELNCPENPSNNQQRDDHRFRDRFRGDLQPGRVAPREHRCEGNQIHQGMKEKALVDSSTAASRSSNVTHATGTPDTAAFPKDEEEFTTCKAYIGCSTQP
jgi:hypothetical protein